MYLDVETLRHSRGRYTSAQVERASKLVGTTGKNLDKVMAKQVSATYVRPEVRKGRYLCKDVPRFVEVTLAPN